MKNEKKEYEWDLSGMFKGINDSKIKDKRKEWENATNKFILKWKKREDYLKDPKIMKEALDDYEKWARFFGTGADEFYYFWLRSHQNQTDSEIKARFNKVEEFSKKIENDINFFSLKIAKIPKEEQNKFLESKYLIEYGHFLKKLFDGAKYLLSENEEKIMNLKSTSAYSSWVKMVSEFLSKEERELIGEDNKKSMKTFSEIMVLSQDKNKKIRDNAAKVLNEILKKNVEAAEVEMNAILADKKVNDSLRGYRRPDEARHISDDIESSIIDTLIEAVSSRFDISKRYYKLKSELLGLPKLEYHERNVEYGSLDKKYSYEEAIKLIEKVMGNLDKKFVWIFNSFIKNNQIDVYSRKGKKDGAFCVHFLKSQPTYVLLNYMDKLNDVETFAHELGHAINNELMKEKQNSLNFDSVLSTAEVASTFMEDFVLQELMKNANDEFKLVLMMQKLNGDISSIMRQAACYMFEQELHKQFREKGYLSKEEIGEMFGGHMKKYMGDYVERSKGSENWWVYWGHIRNYFYNYSYVSGLLISKALQRKVKEDKSFIEKVKIFLSAGTSKSSREIFNEMGLDIGKREFWLGGLKEIESLLDETEKLAGKMKKIK